MGSTGIHHRLPSSLVHPVIVAPGPPSLETKEAANPKRLAGPIRPANFLFEYTGARESERHIDLFCVSVRVRAVEMATLKLKSSVYL